MTAPAPAAALSPADLLFGDLPMEHAATRRILARYPDGKGSWRPHERSRSLAELATHVADVVNRGTAVLETDFLEPGVRTPRAPIDSASALIAHFDAGVARFDAALSQADLEALARPWSIRREGRTMMEFPKRVALRVMMISHLAHHRAQLGVYYRMLGVPVPGTYGPSADD